jgi:predicted transposase/invertase (TIGR01784 family)
VLFPSRSVDTGVTLRYLELLNPQRVTRVYLDELSQIETSSVGIGTVKLVIEPEETAANKAKELINSAQQQIADAAQRRELIQLIETIIVYKFPRLSRKEIEQMLGNEQLKKTRFYQEAFEEGKEEGTQQGIQQGIQQGKLETIPILVKQGLSIEQIAEALSLDVETVRQAARQQTS